MNAASFSPSSQFAHAHIPMLDLHRATLSKERTYFIWVAVIAAALWLLITVLTLGIALLYALVLAFFIWLANGLLIAYLKSEAVLVSEQQLPGLHRTYREVAEKLGLREELPPLYVLQEGGLLNAFTTRHSGRNFVVVYSDMLEACGEDTPQMRFLLGHEFGHIRRKHIVKRMLLWPGLVVPLLGTAYSRACESSCDRFGAVAAGDAAASAHALMILAGGKISSQTMDADSFAQQYRRDRGFFVSWHELTSGYPTLSQRVYNMLTLTQASEPVRARRHPLAYPFALFSAGGPGGTAANFVIMIVIIAVLAGLALPALNAARQRSEESPSRSWRQPTLPLPIPGARSHQQPNPNAPEEE